MKVNLDEVWITSQTLVAKLSIWPRNDGWRVKRYASLDLDEIPEEVIIALYGWYLDAQPEEDPKQIALF